MGMEQKWRRVRLQIGKYMKCHMLALAMPVSGENEVIFLARVMKAYRMLEKSEFPFLTTYNLIKDKEKWKLDIYQMTKGVEQQTGAARRAVVELLERETERAPTVAGTRKPEGIKKARRTIAEMSAKDKEIAKEEAEIEAVLEAVSARGKVSMTALAQGIIRSRAMQSRADDHIMSVDTTGMDEERVEYYSLRRKHALAHARQWEAEKEEQRKSAREEMLATDAALAAETERVRKAFEERIEEEEEEEGEEEDSDMNQEKEGWNGSEEEFDALVRN